MNGAEGWDQTNIIPPNMYTEFSGTGALLNATSLREWHPTKDSNLHDLVRSEVSFQLDESGMRKTGYAFLDGCAAVTLNDRWDR